MAEESITPEIVKKRAELAGITLDDDHVESIAYTMEQALASLRGMDLRGVRLVEPAVHFRAAWSE